MASATNEAKQFVANGKKAGQTYEEIAASMKATSVSAKVATIATAALNAVLTGLVIAAVTFAISKLVKAIDEFIRREEIAAQKAQEARDKINGLKQSFSDNEKTVNSLKQRYAELAQGVDKLGTAFQNQGRLNTEEYEEFLNISNQLADLYPQLTQGYDDNGNAILNLNGSVNTIVGSLDALIERSRQITRMQINEEMGKVWDDDIKNIEKYQEELNNLSSNAISFGVLDERGTGYEDYLKTYQHLLDLINHSATKNLSLTEDLTKQEQELISTALDSLKMEGVNFRAGTDAKGALDAMNIFNFGKLGPEVSQKLREYFSDQIKEYEGLIYQTEDKIAQINARMKGNLVDYLSGDMTYLSLDKNRQQFVNAILNNFDISSIPKDANVNSWEDLTRWYQTNIIQSIAKIDNKEIQQKIGELFSGEGTLAEAEDLYETIYNYLITMFQPDDPIIVYFRGQLEDQQAIVDAALSRLLSNVSDKDMRQQYAVSLRSLLEGASDEFVNWVANDLVIPEGVIYSDQQLLDMWEELQNAAEALSNINPIADISESIRDVNTQLDPFFNSLADLYTVLFEDGVFDFEKIDISKLAAFEQQFNNIADELKEQLGDSFDASIVEKFFSDIKNASNTKDAQQAVNEFATAWFYNTEVMKDLNPETAKYIERMMELTGITNANAIVTQALADAETNQIIQEEIANGASVERIQKLLDERSASEALRIAILQSTLATEGFNDTTVLVSDKINKLKELAGAYLDAANAARVAAYASSLETAMKYGGLSADKADELVQQYVANLSNVAPTEVKWQKYNDPSGKGGGGSDKDETDPIVEKFEKDKEHLDWLRDQDLISQQEYLDQLAILIQNSFGDNEKYADKYYEHMHDLMDQTKDYFDTAISAVNTILDKQIDKYEDLEEAEKKPYETANKEIDKNIRKLEKQTTSIDEVTKSLERQKETIQSKKIDPIQRQIDEIERTYIRPIEREIDALEKGKLRDLQDKINGVWGTDGLDDFIEKANREIQSIQDDLIKPIEKQKEAHQEVIEGINEEIQKMQDANQERQTNINLMKSQYELERQMHQRVNLVYTDDDQLGGQMRYRNDPNAVRDAQENLNNAQFELTIQNKQKEIKLIEDQIADLDKIIDQHNESIEKIQERIDGWEKEKQAIQDEIDALNDYIEYLNRSKEPWEQRIQDLQDEMEIYQLQTETIDRQIEQQNEKKQILEDQLDILNKQKDANEEAITLIEEKYEPLKTQLEEYKKLWSDLADTQEYADAIEALDNFGIKTEAILNGSKETFKEFSSAYYSVLTGITNGNAEALAALSAATNGASDAVKPYIEAMSPYLDKLQALDLTDTNTSLASARELAGQLGTNFSLAERAAIVLGETTVGKGGKGGVISAIMTELGDGETPGTLIGAASEYKKTLDESKTSTEELGATTTATMDETKSVIDEVGNPALDDLKKHTDDNVTSMTNLKDEVGRLGDMIDSLPDSKDITITIKEVHEKVSVGSASGTSKFNGTVGNAFADGYPGLKSNEKDALRSEFGQPELSVYPNGTYELTTTPTISDLPKGTVIFNGEQTKKILSQNGKKSKAFASGSSQYLSLQDVMPEKAAIFERFNANLQANMEALKTNTFDMSRNVADIAKAVTTNNFSNNVVVNGGINVTCPGVTEAEVARNIAPIIQDQFTSIFSGMALRADQRAMRR